MTKPLPDFVLQYLSKGYGFPVTNDDVVPACELPARPTVPPRKASLALFDAKGKGQTFTASMEESILAWGDQVEGPVYACVALPPHGAFMIFGDFDKKQVTFVKDNDHAPGAASLLSLASHWTVNA